MIISESALLKAINAALKLLPRAMDSVEARVALYAIGWQESKYASRWQVLDSGRKGPARGFWQFEKGTQKSRGGIWGVYLHAASRYWLAQLCEARGVRFHPDAIWTAIETDDVLAAGVARLLLFTDPKRLPSVDDEAGCWTMYAKRLWRPGKPHPRTWPEAHRRGRQFALGSS